MKYSVIFAALLVAGCATGGLSTPQTVGAIENTYTILATAGTVAIQSGKLSQQDIATLKSINDAAHSEIVAARTAAENGDSTAAVLLATAEQGITAFSTFETQHAIGGAQ